MRTPRLEDAYALRDLARADKTFAQATVGDVPNSLESACTAIARMLEDRANGTGAWWVVVEKDSLRIVGLTGYSDRTPGLGLVNALATDVMGKGYARETIEALLNLDPLRDLLRQADKKIADDIAEPDEPAARWYWRSKTSNQGSSRQPQRCA